MRTLIDTKDIKADFEDSENLRDAVFERLLLFYKEHEVFDGEMLCQCDAPQIAAPELLSDIAEMINFDVDYK